jgi:hypothetical protein
MRRLFGAATLCAAFLVLTGAAAAGAQHDVRAGQHEPKSAHAPADDITGKAGFAPLGARLATATVTVHGTLRDSYGAYVVGADMEWDSWVDAPESRWYVGEGTTGTGGAFSMTAVPTANGEVWAYPDGDSTLARGRKTWADGGSYDESLYPGRVSVSASRGGRWHDFTKLVVRLSGPDRFSKGAVIAGDTTSTPVSGLVDVLDGAYSSGSAKFFWDEGIEFYGSIGVTSGATSGTSISVDEAAAQRVWMKSPSWYSGKPGTTVQLMLENFPAGWINRVTGYSDDPDAAAAKVLGTWTSRGTTAASLNVKVPATAKPGYGYWTGFQHVDSTAADAKEYPLYLEEIYQVCTLKASKTSVKAGTKIRVTGIIPTQGHWGSQAGIQKTVTLFAHKGKAPVPTSWNPKGWTKVGSVKANGFGAYKTPYFKPLRTLTLVVRYPGDDWYYDAYTSTQKISVR